MQNKWILIKINIDLTFLIKQQCIAILKIFHYLYFESCYKMKSDEIKM